MENEKVQLSVVDADVIAGNNVVYCANVADEHALVGKEFICLSTPYRITLLRSGTGGSAKTVRAFQYSGSKIPRATVLQFMEDSSAGV